MPRRVAEVDDLRIREESNEITRLECCNFMSQSTGDEGLHLHPPGRIISPFFASKPCTRKANIDGASLMFWSVL